MKTNTFWRGLLILVLIAGSLSKVNPVKALGTPQIVGIDPSSPAPVGTIVSIHATVQWDSDFRSMRICFRDENWCQEDGTPDLTKNFDTSGLSAGTYTIIVEVAAVDKGWDTANKTYGSFELTGPSPVPTPIPPPRGPDISIFDFSPGSANIGDFVTIHIKVDSVNPGATKLNVSCGGLTKNETSEVEFYTDWNTGGCPTGSQTVTVLSRDVDDPDWRNPSLTTRSYSLSAPPVPIQSPTANFWVDSSSILQWQCTYLYWDTAYAVSVDIDGSGVNTSGSMQVCPSVTQKFTLTAHASPGGVDAQRNVTITVTAVQQPPTIVDSFQTGDIINIGGNIHVIVDGKRRHVPNPETLDALGIGRSLINNKGFSDSELSQIAQGPDIPDVNIDPTGVVSFREAYLPNLIPIVPKPPTQTPISVSPVVPTVKPTTQPMTQPTAKPIDTFTQPVVVPPEQQPEQQEIPIVTPPKPETFTEWWCKEVGLFCDISVGATSPVNTECSTQCVPEARRHRDDLRRRLWSQASTADGILKDAASTPTFLDNGQLMLVKVRSPGEAPQSGDLIVWPSGCDYAWSGGGHIGYVDSGNPLTITDSNWTYQPGATCSRRDKEPIDYESCMKFITSPIPVETYQSTPAQTTDKCSQYKWPWSWFCKWGLIK